jgi:thymidylate synthase (FAD)
MRIIEPSHEILHVPDGEFIIGHLELAARTCYKSEDKITPTSGRDLLRRIVSLGHESVLEHCSLSVRLTCDRGITHEIVRHRLCSFSQESTRYANYGKDRFGREITVIRPFFWAADSDRYAVWLRAMKQAEEAYLTLIDAGATAQEARSVLPNSLKTEIVVTANIREWRHIFDLRCAAPSHPQMRQLMLPLLKELHGRVPLVFDDLFQRFSSDMDRFAVSRFDPA